MLYCDYTAVEQDMNEIKVLKLDVGGKMPKNKIQ